MTLGANRLHAVASLVLLIVAVALIVLHFVLDVGPSREAPGWIVYAAIAAAVMAALVGVSTQRPGR